MKKKIILALTAMAVGTAVMTGCGSSAKETTAAAETTTAAATEAAEETSAAAEESVGMANPWTDSDKEGVAAATGFEMTPPEGAENVYYAYMASDGLADMTYDLDDAVWVYRMQFADKLTDISGLYVDWTGVDDGTVSGRAAKYYGYVDENEDEDGTGDVQMVNWYDSVTGVTYTLAAGGRDLNGMDIQVYAEELFDPLQGESTDDPEGDRKTELEDYFLGTHTSSYDGSEIVITDNGDDTFSMNLGIVGLCTLEDAAATFEEHKLFFKAEDPSGGQISGMVYRDSDNSLDVKILDSNWELLPKDEVVEGFGK